MTIDTPAQLRLAAMNLLAQREHSRKELHRKLSDKGASNNALEAVLDQLERDRLLNDQRFAETYLRSRVSKGYGCLRISQELQQKGVGVKEISLAMEDVDIDWYAEAERVRQKKFSATPPCDHKDKARQVRFLQYRGFPVGLVMELF